MTHLTSSPPLPKRDHAPASAAVLAENSDARWADWLRRGVERDHTRRARMGLIAGVIAVGIGSWLFLTLR
jgi:hypothetical protein